MAFSQVVENLKKLFDDSAIDDGHGIDHAVIVLRHAALALEEEDIDQKIKDKIMLAALLHDADDNKFFPTHKDNENARQILLKSGYTDIEDIIRMINLVSCSKNRNQPHEPKYELIPRWADRLEAIGEIGLIRSYIYTKYKGLPLFTPETPRAKSIQELFDISTSERFNSYNGISYSMIDHLYDKVLHLVNLGTDNKYLNAEAQKRHMEIVDFCLKFGQDGCVDPEIIERWEKFTD